MFVQQFYIFDTKTNLKLNVEVFLFLWNYISMNTREVYYKLFFYLFSKR